MLRFILVLAFVNLASTGSLAAQSIGVQPEVRELGKFTSYFEEFEEPETRTEFIVALQSYCRALEGAFPRNSPAENDWLRREIESGDINRLMRVEASPEWGRRQAENFITTCLGFTQNFLDYPNQRIVSLFVLIEATTTFSADASIYASRNGLASNQWGFIVLANTIKAMSHVGAWESGELLKLDAQ